MKNLRSLLLATQMAAALCPMLPEAVTAQSADAVQVRGGFRNLQYRCAVEKKAQVAFLGGSITQNGAGHVKRVPDWLRERFPEAEISVINAGLSSTCSVSGAFRVADDVLSHGRIDLLVVEFAVNDDQDAGHDRSTAIRGMEGIVRQVRAANPAADILMVHYVNPEMLSLVQKGETPVSIAAHEAVAAHWGLSSVNVTAALAAEIAAGRLNWETYGGVHPKPEGYRFASDLMIQAIGDGWKAGGIPDAAAPHPTPKTPLDADSFGQVTKIDLQQTSWLGGWKYGPAGKDLMPLGSIRADFLNRPMLRADEPGSTLYVDFRGRALTAFVLAGPDAGTVEVSVDGGQWTPTVLFHRHSKGLNYPRTIILAQGMGPGFHQVALRTSETKPEGSQGTSAAILKLGIAE